MGSTETPGDAPISAFAWPTAQWNDLFYDLALASGIIVLSGAYSADHSPLQAVWLGLTYAVMWGTWVITGSVVGSFSDGPRRPTVPRLAVLVVQMGALLLIAVVADATVGDITDLFDPLLVVALLAAVALAVLRKRDGRPVPTSTFVLLPAASVVVGLSWVVPEAWMVLSLWAVGLGLVGVAAWRAVCGPDVSTQRVVHRLGELTIIVVGETFVKIGLAGGTHSAFAFQAVALLPIFALMATIWWGYFIGPSRATLRGSRPRALWVLAHLPLHLALVALAVGLGKLIIDSKSLSGSGSVTLILGPVALAYATLTALDVFGERRGRLRRISGHLAGTIALIALAIGASVSGIGSPTARTYAAATIALLATMWVARSRAPDRS